jgi:hypothetical protein
VCSVSPEPPTGCPSFVDSTAPIPLGCAGGCFDEIKISKPLVRFRAPLQRPARRRPPAIEAHRAVDGLFMSTRATRQCTEMIGTALRAAQTSGSVESAPFRARPQRCSLNRNRRSVR